MLIREMWDIVRGFNGPDEQPKADTVDTLKFGSDAQELTGVATTMFVSTEVLRQAYAAKLNEKECKFSWKVSAFTLSEPPTVSRHWRKTAAPAFSSATAPIG